MGTYQACQAYIEVLVFNIYIWCSVLVGLLVVVFHIFREADARAAVISNSPRKSRVLPETVFAVYILSLFLHENIFLFFRKTKVFSVF